MTSGPSPRSARDWRPARSCPLRSGCSRATRRSDARHVLSRLRRRRCLEGMTENILTGKRTHVVVIGGGYAGTLAANRLRLRGDVDITLINPRPKFVERIRLHQHAANNYEATADYGSLLGHGINLVVDTAAKIDTGRRAVQFASGRRAMPYDYLIYAVGSTGAVPASIPGAA